MNWLDRLQDESPQYLVDQLFKSQGQLLADDPTSALRRFIVQEDGYSEHFLVDRQLYLVTKTTNANGQMKVEVTGPVKD